MTCYQRGHGRRQLLRAMQQLGGRVMEVSREERDPNGMPTGATTVVCKLYGLRYQQHATTLTLGLDMPGVITSQNSLPRIIAVLLEGTAPETGDLVEGVAILSVEENLGIFCLGLGGEKT